MKKILFILIMMSVGITSFAQEIDYRSIKPPKGKSLVYIVRPSLFGFAAEFKVYANGQHIGNTFGKSYLYGVFEPGEQVFTSTAENKDVLALKTESDKTYFIKQTIITGLMTARSEFSLLNEKEGRKSLMKCELSKSNAYIYNRVPAGSTNDKATVQPTQQESIDNVQAEVHNDSLVISFNLNTNRKIEAVWVKIGTSDGKEIIDSLLDKKIWDKGVAGSNRKICWVYANKETDLAGQDILINVKADVAAPEAAKVPVYKAKEIAKYPLLEPGFELSIDPKSNQDEGKATMSLTLEYIAKPSWSILSGIGVHVASVKSVLENLENESISDIITYGSIIVPLTIEYKLNTGSWFRIYGGGGIQNRFVFYEDDEYLNIGQGLKRYILGVKAEAGIEIRNVRLGATYLSDIDSYSEFNEKMTYLGLTLAWRFGGSKAYIK